MIYVITGGPGFGKTTLIDQLSLAGYPVGKEAAREIIEQQTQTGGDILPWKDSTRFETEVAKIRVALLEQTPSKIVAFADRGLPDQVAFSWYKGKQESNLLAGLNNQYHYAPQVFVTPPWREIYCQDTIRQESFEEACTIHQFILKAYQHYGYQIIEIPFDTPQKRVGFILQHIKQPKQ